MKTQIYKIKLSELRRLTTFLQHQLRQVVKCYTMVNLNVDQEKQEFVFQKHILKNGFKILDPKVYKGTYELEESEIGYVNLVIHVEL